LHDLYLWVATTSARRGTRSTLASLEPRLPAPRWSSAQRSQILSAIAAVQIVSEGSLARARRAGILRIATTADYAPFSEYTDGALSGVDIELALGLAAALRLQPQFVRTTWRDLMHDLHAGRFDVAVGGISVTPEREAQAAFSTALFKGGKTAIGRCADGGRYASFASIDQAGVRVIYNKGGTNEAFVRRTVRRAEVRSVDDNRLTFDEILQKRADVMFTDDTEVELQHRRHPELCRLSRDTFMPTTKAFLMPRDPHLQSAVSDWVDAEINAHEPDRLMDRYLKGTGH
jgi:cyclohexadienyl dehydratase